jgi:hypothetical protein
VLTGFEPYFLDTDSMDLSWNYAAESQAYDRVHRLGQEKDVFVKRLVVENTIEERMLCLQEVKMGAHKFQIWLFKAKIEVIETHARFVGLADAALGEGTGVKLNKLSVREIRAVSVSLYSFIARNSHSCTALRYVGFPESHVISAARGW